MICLVTYAWNICVLHIKSSTVASRLFPHGLLSLKPNSAWKEECLLTDQAMLVGIIENTGALQVPSVGKSHLDAEASQHFLRQTGSGSTWAPLLWELGNGEPAIPFLHMLHTQFCDLPQELTWDAACSMNSVKIKTEIRTKSWHQEMTGWWKDLGLPQKKLP